MTIPDSATTRGLQKEEHFTNDAARLVVTGIWQASVEYADIYLGAKKTVFFTNDADAELNGGNQVYFINLGIMKFAFFGEPGLSGIAPETRPVCPRTILPKWIMRDLAPSLTGIIGQDCALSSPLTYAAVVRNTQAHPFSHFPAQEGRATPAGD